MCACVDGGRELLLSLSHHCKGSEGNHLTPGKCGVKGNGDGLIIKIFNF